MMNASFFQSRINLNRSGETPEQRFMVAGKKWATFTIKPDATTYTTFVANVRYKLGDGDTWRDFPTTIQLTSAAPTSGLIQVYGIPEITVQITTVQGSESYAQVFGFAEGNID